MRMIIKSISALKKHMKTCRKKIAFDANLDILLIMIYVDEKA